MSSKSVLSVKTAIQESVGKKIIFKIKKGKSKSQVNEGVIADVYPAIFTVYVERRGLTRVMSFNYIDLLTNYVEIFLCNEEQTKII